MIGSDLGWTGGETHLVSLGDLLDRGDDARKVLDLVMRLQREAVVAGGRVHVVLGNHELMNLLGDWRYVAAGDYAAYAAEETAAVRAAAFAALAATAADGQSALTQQAFDNAYPPGYFARQAAFAASGRYGAWLLSLPTIVVINDTAIVHGGLPAVVGEAALDLNDRVRADLNRYLALRDRLNSGSVPPVDRQRDVEVALAAIATASPEVAPQLEELVALGDAPELGVAGPLWYRGSIYCKPVLEEATLDTALERLGVTRVVVGHTPTAGRRVRSLYGGKLLAIDTGMLAEYFHGRAAALVLEGPEIGVQYLGEPRRAGLESGNAVAYGRTEAELLEALENGTVTGIERGEAPAAWQVMLSYEAPPSTPGSTRAAATAPATASWPPPASMICSARRSLRPPWSAASTGRRERCSCAIRTPSRRRTARRAGSASVAGVPFSRSCSSCTLSTC
jgi:hypothetical protein